MGKMSFTELQEEIYTEELKKIEKESNDYYSEYLSLKHKEDGAVALANIFAGRQPRFMPKWHRN